MFGQLYPTISYTAGVGISLFNRLLIDARVASGFKAMENCLSYDINHSESYIKTTMFNGVTHPSIGLWTCNNEFQLLRKYDYLDYKNRMD